ncbi:MAG: cupin domain-containing protein [bacterium]
MKEEGKKSESESSRLPAAQAVRLDALLDYVPGSVVSRTLVKNAAGTVTLFSFDQGQELSEHTAPFDALIQVLDGKVRLTIGGKAVRASAGETVLMPANVPHAVQAVERFKMLLVMVRG